MREAKNLSLRNLPQTINRYFSSWNLEENGSQDETRTHQGQKWKNAGICKNSIKKAEPQGELSLLKSPKNNWNIISKKYLQRTGLLPGIDGVILADDIGKTKLLFCFCFLNQEKNDLQTRKGRTNKEIESRDKWGDSKRALSYLNEFTLPDPDWLHPQGLK